MIIKAEQVPVTTINGLHGGNGTLLNRNFLGPEDVNGAGRLFAVSTLGEGDSVGWHTHDGDSETFYILNGKAKVMDADKSEHILGPGDVLICRDGDGHSIAAYGGPVDYIALILFTEQQK